MDGDQLFRGAQNEAIDVTMDASSPSAPQDDAQPPPAPSLPTSATSSLPPDSELVASLPVYLSKSLLGDSSLHVFQYPIYPRDRPLPVPYSAAARGLKVSSRWRPRANRVEVELPLDVRAEVYNSERGVDFGAGADVLAQKQARADAAHGVASSSGEASGSRTRVKKEKEEEAAANRGPKKLEKVKLESTQVPNATEYMVGVIRDQALHLSRLESIVQLRPSMDYLDALDEAREAERRRDRAALAGELDSDEEDEEELIEMEAPGEGSSRSKAKKDAKKPAAQTLSVALRTDPNAKKGGGIGMGSGSGTGSEARDLLMAAQREAEAERWLDLEWRDERSHEAQQIFNAQLFAASQTPLTCKTKPRDAKDWAFFRFHAASGEVEHAGGDGLEPPMAWKRAREQKPSSCAQPRRSSNDVRGKEPNARLPYALPSFRDHPSRHPIIAVACACYIMDDVSASPTSGKARSSLFSNSIFPSPSGRRLSSSSQQASSPSSEMSASRSAGNLFQQTSMALQSFAIESVIAASAAPPRLPVAQNKEPLSLPTTTKNFRGFVQKSGPMFWFQDGVEATLMWQDTSWTLMWMAIWAVISIYPWLLLLAPSTILSVILIMTHRARYQDTMTPNIARMEVPRSPKTRAADAKTPPVGSPAEVLAYATTFPTSTGEGVVQPPLVPNPPHEGTVAMKLEPGWEWIPGDEWRIDWGGSWSAVGVDDQGYVYTDSSWQKPASYSYGHGGGVPDYPPSIFDVGQDTELDAIDDDAESDIRSTLPPLSAGVVDHDPQDAC
ncbi:hypothetical protein L1887_48769 [Cichorium endivia]|nr:hypothetical protein L1887_48769 [Cichorium endivia]